MTAKYKKRPITFEAMAWSGDDDAAAAIREWVEVPDADGTLPATVVDTDDVQDSWNSDLNLYILPNGQLVAAPQDERCLIVFAPAATLVAHPGWVIVRGIANQYDALPPDMFDATYEQVASS